MRRLLIFVLMLLPVRIWAQGACPSAAVYLNPYNVTGSLVTLSSLGITGCYYVDSNGNDSATGTDEAHPWLHAPGMPSATGNALTVYNSHIPSGTGIIFRGGDTWHWGNPSATPYTGLSSNCDGGGTPCGFHIESTNGTVAHPIYFGVDPSWFSGGSWTRPIFNGDNPLSTSGVSACTFDQSGESFLMEPFNVVNVIVDNFEFTGGCWSGANNAFNYVSLTTSTVNTNRVVMNSYAHGWTHQTFSCSIVGGEPSGHCDGATFITGPSDRTLGVGDHIAFNVCDGSDSDQHSFTCIFTAGYEVDHNWFSSTTTGMVTNGMHSLHDNMFQNLLESGDNVSHSNASEFNVEFAGINVVYNNVYRNMWLDGFCEVTMWETPFSTDYAFNNVVYANACTSNYWNEVLSGTSSFTANLFNNTFFIPTDNPGIAGAPAGSTVNFQNDHCMTPSGGTAVQCSNFQGSQTYNGTINQSYASAAAQGYNSSGAYAYAPTSGAGSTVGAGVNESAYCSALSGSSDPLLQAAGTACLKDTTYAVSYNTTNHTLTANARTPLNRPSGAWDVGAYQFSGSASAATPTLAPPGGTYVSAQSVVLSTTTPGASICFTLDGSTPTAPVAGTCSGGTTQTYTTPINISSTTTLQVLATKSGLSNSSVVTGVYTISNAPAVIQTATTGVSVLASQITFTGLGAGHYLHVGAYDGTGLGHSVTFTDSQANPVVPVWTTVLAADHDTLAMACIGPVSSGTDTITSFVNGVQTTTRMVAYEVLNSTCTQDGKAVAQNTTAQTSCNSGPKTTTVANDFLFAFCGIANNQSPMSAGSGWQNGANAGSSGLPNSLGETQVGASPGSFTATSGVLTSTEQATILAAFARTDGHTVTTAVSGGGVVTATGAFPCAGKWAVGNTISCTAAANSGYTQASPLWTGCPSGDQTTNPCQWTLATSDVSLTANFTLTGVSLTTSVTGGGTATIGGTNCASGSSVLSPGTNVVCTAVGTGGSAVTGSSGTGDASGHCSGATCTFTINSTSTVTFTALAPAPTPTFAPGTGAYSSVQSVTISDTLAGSTICYTTDNSTPTANGAGVCTHGTTYSAPVSVSSSLTLKAIASKSGSADSAVGSAVYTINLLFPPSLSGNLGLSGNIGVIP